MANVGKICFVVGVFIVAALLSAYITYRHENAAAYERISTGSEIIETACGPIEYADVGEGPPLLMIHGAGGGFDQSVVIGRLLIDAGYRMIAPSRFGYLRTPLPEDATSTAQADAHACLLDALSLESVAVVAASLGSPSAVQLCLRHPQRCESLVLVVPVLHSPTGPSEFLQQSMARARAVTHEVGDPGFLFWAATRAGSPLLIETLIGVPYDELRNASAVEQQRIDGIFRLAMPAGARVEGVHNDLSSELQQDALERITVPTLAISVETDMYGTADIARHVVDQVPGARLLMYADGGHLWVGHHEEMLSEIAAFVLPDSIEN